MIKQWNIQPVERRANERDQRVGGRRPVIRVHSSSDTHGGRQKHKNGRLIFNRVSLVDRFRRASD